MQLSWNNVHDAAKKIVARVRASNFIPDYVIGVTTGGLVPLFLIAKELDTNKVLTITARSYDKDRKRGDVVISYLPELSLRDKKVLLVDEIADTGTTLQKIAEVLKEKYAVGELKTATIAVNTEHCTQKPDIWIVESKEWIVFPWDV